MRMTWTSFVLGVALACGCRRTPLPAFAGQCVRADQAIAATISYLDQRPKVRAIFSMSSVPRATEYKGNWIVSLDRKERDIMPAVGMFFVEKSDCSVDGPHGK